ncbi:hypothetical protein PybrP1_001384 [[Pythium] brassicae (nom. inval.)]|nr:hypothetical protein PybrP1_001384 [[Pythium] brassicae (nom. inval.)]
MSLPRRRVTHITTPDHTRCVDHTLNKKSRKNTAWLLGGCRRRRVPRDEAVEVRELPCVEACELLGAEERLDRARNLLRDDRVAARREVQPVGEERGARGLVRERRVQARVQVEHRDALGRRHFYAHARVRGGGLVAAVQVRAAGRVREAHAVNHGAGRDDEQLPVRRRQLRRERAHNERQVGAERLERHVLIRLAAGEQRRVVRAEPERHERRRELRLELLLEHGQRQLDEPPACECALSYYSRGVRGTGRPSHTHTHAPRVVAREPAVDGVDRADVLLLQLRDPAAVRHVAAVLRERVADKVEERAAGAHAAWRELLRLLSCARGRVAWRLRAITTCTRTDKRIPLC